MIYDHVWDRFVVTSTDQADPEGFGAERAMTKTGPVRSQLTVQVLFEERQGPVPG